MPLFQPNPEPVQIVPLFLASLAFIIAISLVQRALKFARDIAKSLLSMVTTAAVITIAVAFLAYIGAVAPNHEQWVLYVYDFLPSKTSIGIAIARYIVF